VARLSLRLIPQNREFYDLFNQAGSTLLEVSSALVDLLAGFPEGLQADAARIRTLETTLDEVSHRIVRLLNTSFVTPFDREDVYALASRLDDICDHIDEAADEILLYGVRQIPPEAVGQADVIRRACIALAAAIGRLDGLRDVHELLVELHTLENEGDRLNRAAIARLFDGGFDALVVIRWKDIHEQLEAAIDSCEQAAHVLESVYLKNR
jgi:uncharacterized protein Yka (UPF0111/DUF47 family)